MNHTHTDKIFAATACLTENELAGYCKKRLSKAEQHRLERHLVDCALCAAAVASFEAAPTALSDLPELKKTLVSKTSRYAHKSIFGMNTALVAVFTVIGFVAVSFAVYYTYSKNKTQQQQQQSPESLPVNRIDVPKPAASLQTEHFIQPGAPVHSVPTPQPALVPNDTQVNTHIAIEPMQEAPAAEVKPVTPVNTPVAEEAEKPLEFVYNSPVGYIRDLKITDFEKYYRTNNTIELKSIGGLSAQYDNEHTRDKHDDTQPAERKVTADEVLNDALGYFNQGRFGKCIAGFELLLSHNPKDVNALFYSAVCNVHLEMHGRAIPLLDKVLASPNNTFHQEAEWYKTLALYGKGDRAGAKSMMEEIVKKNGFYKKQAQEKLKTF